MSEYLDLTPLSDSDIKRFCKFSIWNSYEDKLNMQKGRFINKKAVIIEELEKAYKIRIFYKTYNKNKILFDTSIITCIPKGEIKYSRGEYNKKSIVLRKIKEND